MGALNKEGMLRNVSVHGTFTRVPTGKFPKILLHVPWFIRLKWNVERVGILLMSLG
jgi:hypothetical protein